MNLSRRPETPDDDPFLRRLLFERIGQELPLDHLPAPMRDQILEMQVRLRLDAVRVNSTGGSSEIILVDGEPAGWVLVCPTDAELRLVEIVVAARYRGQGIGATVVSQVIAQAVTLGKPLRLLVDVMNPNAQRLYERLGFRRVGGDQIQHMLEFRPSGIS